MRTTRLMTRSEALVEAQRCLGCFDPPCQQACPARVNIPGFIRRLSAERRRHPQDDLLTALAQAEEAMLALYAERAQLADGQQIKGSVEEILQAIGLELTVVADAHLCCGSAGTYSILQPELSQRLKANKLAALEADGPEVIATANIGCLVHLASGAAQPVRHWIEVLDDALLDG